MQTLGGGNQGGTTVATWRPGGVYMQNRSTHASASQIEMILTCTTQDVHDHGGGRGDEEMVV